jgi:hypothetical protein
MVRVRERERERGDALLTWQAAHDHDTHDGCVQDN